MKRRILKLAGAAWVVALMFNPSSALGIPISVFYADFSSGVPSEFSGVITTESVQGYAALGTGTNIFSNDFLRNTTGEYQNPSAAQKTVLTLSGLPAHTSIDINFLLATINSWDGSAAGPAPDYFNVALDGAPIFSETLQNSPPPPDDQTYAAPLGVLLDISNLGWDYGDPLRQYDDGAYDMGLDPTFNAIPHSASTVSIEWFASGMGWQGSWDESWAIDNVEVIVNTPAPIPEPTTVLLLGTGLVGFAVPRIRRKLKK